MKRYLLKLGKLLIVLPIVCFNGFTFAQSIGEAGPSIDEIIDKYKIKNYWFYIMLGKDYVKLCDKRTVYIDGVGKGFIRGGVYFIYRGDEADKPRHTFEISCPLIAKGSFIYNLYGNKNQKILIDSCKKDKKNGKFYIEGNYVKTKLGKDALGKNEEICIFHHPDLIIDTDGGKLYVKTTEEKNLTKVLPNKLMFDSYAKPAMLSIILFFFVLSILFWREGF